MDSAAIPITSRSIQGDPVVVVPWLLRAICVHLAWEQKRMQVWVQFSIFAEDVRIAHGKPYQVIFPSDRNGVVGIKPTVGLVSRQGVIPEASSLDTVGTLGRTVMDAAIALDGITGAFDSGMYVPVKVVVGVLIVYNPCKVNNLGLRNIHPKQPMHPSLLEKKPSRAPNSVYHWKECGRRQARTSLWSYSTQD